MAEALASRLADTSSFTYAGTPETMSSAVAAYEMNAMALSGILK